MYLPMKWCSIAVPSSFWQHYIDGLNPHHVEFLFYYYQSHIPHQTNSMSCIDSLHIPIQVKSLVSWEASETLDSLSDLTVAE